MTTRQLLDAARGGYDGISLYALAQQVGLEPYQVQRYYRNDSMPESSRLLFEALLNADATGEVLEPVASPEVQADGGE